MEYEHRNPLRLAPPATVEPVLPTREQVRPRLDTLRDELRGLLSLLIFLGVTAFLFRSLEFALILTASLGFHELGHAVGLMRFRLNYRIFFSWVGAWTWSHLPERKALSHLANTYIHLAGPLFSLMLALFAMTLHALWLPDSQHLLILANLSAQIGFLNLLPLGILTDGGKALRRMALSAGSPRARAAILLIGASSFILPALAVLQNIRYADLRELSVGLLGLLIIGFWLFASILYELLSGRHAQDSAVMAGRRPMTPGQIAFIALFIWDMLAVLLVIIQVTPFWLDPKYVMGSLANVEVLLTWLIQLI